MRFFEVSLLNLYFAEVMHGIIAIPAALFLFNKFKSFKNIILYYLVVYFIDLDHLFDYFSYYTKFNLYSFLNVEYFELKNTAYLIFHAWEYVVILFLIYVVNKNKYFLILALAIGSHLLWDSLSNGLGFSFYFMIVRISNGFVFS